MSVAVEHLAKSFRGARVLSDVSFNVPTGETLVLFGPSGVGKTVLLRLIAGFVRPDRGTISIGGRDMADVEPEDRGIGMAFQNFALFPHMDARANIASALLARRASRSATEEAVQRVAKLLKIDHVLAHRPKALSNGQKQRTSLARALSAEPDVLLLDDPLRNVDAKLRFEMRLELPRLLKLREATVIYVTQDYREAMALGDRIAVLGAGGIAQLGTPGEIYRTPATVTIARLFGDPAINLFDVTPQRHGEAVEVTLSGVPLRLAHPAGDAADRACVLGVRLEAVRFVDADAPGAIPVEVEAVTPLNEKVVTLCLTEGGREIMVSRPSGTAGPESGRAHVAIEPAQVHLFDKDSGARIVPRPAAALRREVA